MTLTTRQTLNISIIIPALNEACSISRTIQQAQKAANGEIIVIDGGSRDATRDIAGSKGVKVRQSEAGRAVQMNCGVREARGDILLFLHADTLLPDNFQPQILQIMKRSDTVAGAFRFAIDLPGVAARLVEFFTNLRSRLWQLPYGDQAIFVRRADFNKIGGYPEEPILEDVLLIKKLQKLGKIKIAETSVITSGRRWQEVGIFKTTLINQKIMLGYLFGLSPKLLKGWYRIGKKG